MEALLILFLIIILVIVSLSLNRVNEIGRKVDGLMFNQHLNARPEPKPQMTPPVKPAPPAEEINKHADTQIHAIPAIKPVPIIRETIPAKPKPAEPFFKPLQPAKPKIPSQQLEVKIGIYGAIIIGGIALMVGLIFLLKNAFTPFLTTAQGKITVISLTGFAFLIIGEITRRRGYGFVAKSTTAIGFAVFYAAVFSAYNYFHLISNTTAFTLAIVITAASFVYAVCLEEVAMAVMALLGGYLSPVLLSTNENRPHALFIYILILSLGSMGCSIFRKWKAINILSFAGYFILYTGWFEKFYTSSQMSVGLSYLGIFFLIFLLMPVFYEMIKAKIASKEAAVLILANAVATLYYLSRILYDYNRSVLAATFILVAAAHFAVFIFIGKRCKADLLLPPILLSITMFCVTSAIATYFELSSAIMAFASVSVIEAIIASKYRNKIIQIFSFISVGLAVLWIMDGLPLHTAQFKFIFNKDFASCAATAVAFYMLHLVHRKAKPGAILNGRYWPSILVLIFIISLFAACIMEWSGHIRFNLNISCLSQLYDTMINQAMIVVGCAAILILITKPVSPSDILCKYSALCIAALGLIGAPITMVMGYAAKFNIFLNSGFGIAALFSLVLFLSSLITYKQNTAKLQYNRQTFIILGFMGIAVLWGFLTEEIYLYWHYLGVGSNNTAHYRFLGQMYISVMWAIYATILIILGFVKNNTSLRYTALGLYGLIVFKVFIFDMSELDSIYRIAGLTALGIALIGVSFLYQYNRKKGLFENLKQKINAE